MSIRRQRPIMRYHAMRHLPPFGERLEVKVYRRGLRPLVHARAPWRVASLAPATTRAAPPPAITD